MQIVFTRILSGAYSLARDFVRLIPAARDTLVGNPRADGVLAPRLVTLMMRPPPRFFMCGIQSRHRRTAAKNLSSVVEEDVHPAPLAHDLADELVDLVRLADVHRARQHLPARLADPFRRAFQHVGTPRADGHARPFGGQPLGGRAPEPFAAARDDGHLAAESEIEHQGLLEER